MQDALPPQLADFPVVIRWPVQWGDQDAFGHVNNTIFIRWFESARIAYMDRVGLTELMDREQIGPILAAITCHFRRQVKFPDTMAIGARITRLGRSSLTMEHRIVSLAAGALAAEGESVIVVFDYRGQKPRSIPPELREAIERLEGRELPRKTGAG